MYFDEARVWVKAGDGGNGSASLRREKFVPRGGPDGGDGGRGGSVYLVATDEVNTLLDFRYRRHFKAEHGGNGAIRRRHGKSGNDLEIPVPVGTIVRTEDGESMADLDAPGKRVMVAMGGRGGLGNTHFATPTYRTPRVAEKGEPGEERWILLELRLIADVGVIGYPSAGKSTFLGAVTRANPKIADYPFTTLTPNLGVALLDDRTIGLADIPGLIEGAHRGVGLGHTFLRHISRTRALIHVIDGSMPDPVATYDAVNEELRLFDPGLASKPQIVAINKIDIPEVAAHLDAIRNAFADRGVDAIPMSAQTGDGVENVLARAMRVLDEVAAAEPVPAPMATPSGETIVLRPRPIEPGFSVEREPGAFRVTGQKVERIVAMTDFNNEEGIARLQRELRRMGVSAALERAGAQPGDVVRIGRNELEWVS